MAVPHVDYIVVQETKLKGLRDPLLLAWAAENQRILVTHDVNPIPRYASERVRASEPLALRRFLNSQSEIRIPKFEGCHLPSCSCLLLFCACFESAKSA